MSTTSDTVRVNRKTLERLKDLASLGKQMLTAETVELRDAARHRLKREAVTIVKGDDDEIAITKDKSTFRIAGVAALIQFVSTLDSIRNVEIIKKHWWLLPAGVLALGWFLKRKGYKDGPTVLAVGAALLVQAYRDQEEAEAKKKTQTQVQPAPNTAGFYDTGALSAATAAAAGQQVWLQTPWGAWTRVGLPAPLYNYAATAPAALPQPSQVPANMNTAGPTQEEYEAAQQLAAMAFAA